MNLGDAWTFLLETIGKIIIPVWNDLIQYLPLLLLLLLFATIAGLAWYWQRNSAMNRSRVPSRLPSGRKPADLHLPGPSLWPFVAPIGLVLVLFSIAFGAFDSLATMALLALGATVGVIGIAGWYLDASKEYATVEAGGHGEQDQLSAEATAKPPGWSLQPPEGMHLPGPSAWPFLAPVGLLFLVAGLIFGVAMMAGGLIMATIAVIGWLLDADREFDDLQEHGHPSQADRDPQKAWPRRLIPVYFAVGTLALVITLAPWLLSLLPGSN
ncbi:MAG: hypothetical protein ACC726_06995 [Chloroflexota bacterium]